MPSCRPLDILIMKEFVIKQVDDTEHHVFCYPSRLALRVSSKYEILHFGLLAALNVPETVSAGNKDKCC